MENDGIARPSSSPFGSEVAQLLDETRRLVTQLTETSWWAVGDADLLAGLHQLEALRRRLEAVRLTAIGEADSRGVTISTGARTTAAWLVDRTGVSRGDANRSVQQARRITVMSAATRDAVRSGGLSLDHARVVRDVASTLWQRSIRLDSPLTADVRAEAEATLIDLAGSLDPGQLALAGRYLVERLDPDGEPDEEEQARQEELRRRFTCTPTPDGGGRFHGELDAEGFALVLNALSPLSAPRPTTAEGPDRRTLSQRQGDGLVELARRAIECGDLPEEGGLATAVVVTTDLATLRGELSEQAPTLDTGVEVSVESLRRMACDAHIIPAVLGSTPAALDIGRSSRVVPSAMRRALVVRDQRCAFPGCQIPAAWCDAHHVVPWACGGVTALSNPTSR